MTNPALMIKTAADQLKPNTSCFIECDLAIILVARNLYNQVELFPYNNAAERILQEVRYENDL